MKRFKWSGFLLTLNLSCTLSIRCWVPPGKDWGGQMIKFKTLFSGENWNSDAEPFMHSTLCAYLQNACFPCWCLDGMYIAQEVLLQLWVRCESSQLVALYKLWKLIRKILFSWVLRFILPLSLNAYWVLISAYWVLTEYLLNASGCF